MDSNSLYFIHQSRSLQDTLHQISIDASQELSVSNVEMMRYLKPIDFMYNAIGDKDICCAYYTLIIEVMMTSNSDLLMITSINQ
ncbi:hypothetical protein G6F68_018178 [Rhizopus microsporus]|nr:hypothetical protein G6F68_018178 [Rhizopus microsporus]